MYENQCGKINNKYNELEAICKSQFKLNWALPTHDSYTHQRQTPSHTTHIVVSIVQRVVIKIPRGAVNQARPLKLALSPLTSKSFHGRFMLNYCFKTVKSRDIKISELEVELIEKT